MTANIYVVMHKKTEIPVIDGYKSLFVGSCGMGDRSGIDCFDDDGLNISEKNKNYCELTGLYWMWKNTSDDIEGLCHYRRYFTKSWISVDCKYYLCRKDLENLFAEYDVVMPVKRYYKEKVVNAVEIAPNMDDIVEMRRAIHMVCPDYSEAYEAYLYGNKCYLYNMFIMKKELLDQYCQWLFSILDFIESEYAVDNSDPYRSRLFGFLSERLIYVWVTKNIPKEKIKEYRVVKTDENPIWLIGQDVKNILRNVIFHIKQGLKR